ncbi:MAG TPA: CoA transferase, partial [Stellaceae bacterium]|nr:CoA transferase [Stellaceae bacterium]
TSSARRDNRKELERLLGKRLKQRTRDEWIAELRGIGIPAGPVYDVAQVFSDPSILDTGVVEATEHPLIGELELLASPLKLECLAKGSVRRPPPLLGQHTSEILDELGFSKHTIAELKRLAVVRS